MRKEISFSRLAGLCKYRDVSPPYRGWCEMTETPFGTGSKLCTSKHCPVWARLRTTQPCGKEA